MRLLPVQWIKPPAITAPSRSPTCSDPSGRHANAIQMDGSIVAPMHHKRPLVRFDLRSCGSTMRVMMDSFATYRPSTAAREARIQRWFLPAVGCAGLFCGLFVGADCYSHCIANVCRSVNAILITWMVVHPRAHNVAVSE